MEWILRSIARPESLSFLKGYPVAAALSNAWLRVGAEISAVLA
jgi:hypothetical protein